MPLEATLKGPLLTSHKKGVMWGNRGRIEESCDSWDFPFGVNKEVVGTHVLLTRWLFACDILRRLLLHVSLAKSTSVLCDSDGFAE